MEFKDIHQVNTIHNLRNAVAPDWNLKQTGRARDESSAFNAVAPDWNLKVLLTAKVIRFSRNAVAPDWNLKL